MEENEQPNKFTKYNHSSKGRERTQRYQQTAKYKEYKKKIDHERLNRCKFDKEVRRLVSMVC